LTLESARLGTVRPSATVRMAALARAMQSEGRDVISLASGEPDFDTPGNIRRAAIEAIEKGRTKYTTVDGIPELKAAVAAKFEWDNGLHYDVDEISVAPGGKAVIYNALVATLSAGDEVIIPAPYWVSYPDLVRLAGGTAVILPTESARDFKLEPAALEANITARTKWLILNSPSNPTGAVYGPDELRRIADVLLRHPHVWVLSDDIYEHILFDGRRFATIAQIEPRLLDRCLTVNGVSKGYAMTGWRIGFAGGPKPIIELMAKVMGQTTSNACSVAQWAAVEALTGPQEFIPARLAIYDERRRWVVDELSRAEGLACTPPDGAFYAFVSCRDQIGRCSPSGRIIEDDEDFALELLQSEGVAVVHGSAFGASGYFRVSFATDTALLKKACARILRFCSMTSETVDLGRRAIEPTPERAMPI
jgi:aspartate aminotransferase